MAAAGGVGDWLFKSFTAGLGIATVYLTANLSINVFRGFAWHSAQSKGDDEGEKTSSDLKSE
ncbi:hypothetical protein M569_07764 [Genlisea aurea]|uniref:Uncharacterized protein n=1 Tax=Genlisea aurea TaxID=192259 RepID=S8DV26_9LAMI|nr:hypothetical protein M569_07764 [Genlisea aurea]